MPSEFTKKDVFLYFADKLDPARRRQIESARQTDERVRRWFEELSPKGEGKPQPAAVVRLDAAEYRDLAAIAYLSVERDELDSVWGDWFRDLGRTEGPIPAPPVTVVPRELFEAGEGTLLYRDPAPATLSGDTHRFSFPSLPVPCIHPDYGQKRLTIQQELDRVPGGLVEVIVVRRLGDDKFERVSAPLRLQLQRVVPPGGEPYWYGRVSLNSLIPDLQPKTDYIYCVQAVPGA
jgi:hypothetical protein